MLTENSTLSRSNYHQYYLLNFDYNFQYQWFNDLSVRRAF